MKLDDEQFDALVTAITKISHGTTDVMAPTGFEVLSMSISGTGIPTDEKSLAYQTLTGLDSVATAIRDLADAYRERTRRLG